MNSESIIDEIFKEINKVGGSRITGTRRLITCSDLEGGRKNRVSGTRQILGLSEFLMNDSSESESSLDFSKSESTIGFLGGDSSDSEKENLGDIEKIIDEQTKTMFKYVVEKFMEKKHVDQDQATKLKDELYEKVSKDHPELNDYDRASKMKEIVDSS